MELSWWKARADFAGICCVVLQLIPIQGRNLLQQRQYAHCLQQCAKWNSKSGKEREVYVPERLKSRERMRGVKEKKKVEINKQKRIDSIPRADKYNTI